MRRLRASAASSARPRTYTAFHVPGPARRSGPAASQDERWALTARLLHDHTPDLTDRAADRITDI